MKATRTKYGIYHKGNVVPASRRFFKGAVRLEVRTLEERILGLKWYAPDQIKA